MKSLKIFLFSLIVLISCSNSNMSNKANNSRLKLIWSKSKIDWITSSINVNGNKLYFGTFDNYLFQVDLTSKNIDWKFKTQGKPYFKPLLLEKSILFSTLGNLIYSIDYRGKLVWHIETTDRIKSNILFYQNYIYGSIRGEALKAFDVKDGRVIWELKLGENDLSSNQPILYNKSIYVGDIYDNFYSINTVTGSINWKIATPGRLTSEAEIGGNNVYLLTFNYLNEANSSINCYNQNRGDTLWIKSYAVNALFRPTFYDGNIYFSTTNGLVVCLDANNGNLKWEKKLDFDAHVATNMSVFNNSLFFGTTNKMLYSLNGTNGSVVFTEQFEYGLSDPILIRERLLIGTGEGSLFEIIL